MMEDKNRHVMEETEVDVQIRPNRPQPQANNNRPNWSNGNCGFFICSYQVKCTENNSSSNILAI